MKKILLCALLGTASFAMATDWPVVNLDTQNSRFNSQETIITPTTVANLVPLDTFSTPNGDQIAPIVVGDVLYTGDVSGNLFAVPVNNLSTPTWQVTLPGPIDAPPSLVNGVLYVATGTGDCSLYAINPATGATLAGWPVRIDPNIDVLHSDVLAGPVVAESYVIVPLVDGGAGTNLTPTIHQTLNAFDATTGALKWRQVIQPEPFGPQGGSFSTASVDTKLKYIFIGTSNNDNAPVGDLSDALLAIDYTTGKVKWSYQFTKNDAWGPLYPNDPDHDVGASPNLFTIKYKGKNTDVVGVSSKRGIYRVLIEKAVKNYGIQILFQKDSFLHRQLHQALLMIRLRTKFMFLY